MVVSNTFTFDEKTKGCNGVAHEVINSFNKSNCNKKNFSKI